MNQAAASQQHPTTIQELNIDMFTFALRCLAKGDISALHRIGLSEWDVPHLRRLSFSQLIDLSDRGLSLVAYLGETRYQSSKDELILALIRQSAPRELMMQLFRISTRRFSAERVRLGLSDGRGRPAIALMDSTIEHRIWRLWILFAQGDDPKRLRRADHWLLIAQEAPGHLRAAWALIQRWAREPETVAILIGDRVRLGADRLDRLERELRNKHKSGLELLPGIHRHAGNS